MWMGHLQSFQILDNKTILSNHPFTVYNIYFTGEMKSLQDDDFLEADTITIAVSILF